MTYFAFIEPEAAAAVVTEIWRTIFNAMGDGSERYMASALPVYASCINEIIMPSYTATGFEFFRYAPTDFSDLGLIPALTDYWDYDNSAVTYDDAEGLVWIVNDVAPKLAKLDLLGSPSFRLTEFTLSPVTIPVSHQDWYGTTTTLNFGYYVPMVNPFNGDLYYGDQEQFTVFHKVNKTTGQPSQSYYMVEDNIVQASPYSGQGSSSLTYVFLGPIVFTSSTVAYMVDFNASDLFHVNLSTGVLTFVHAFRHPDYPARYNITHPVYYDSTTGTLWFISKRQSAFEAFASPPKWNTFSIISWKVGTNPSNMVERIIEFDQDMTDQENSSGYDAQQHWVRGVNYDPDPSNNGFWIEFYYSEQNYGSHPAGSRYTQSESLSVWRRFWSCTDAAFSKFGVNSVIPSGSPITSDWQDAFSSWGFALKPTTTLHWIPQQYDGSFSNEVVVKFFFASTFVQPLTGRYVRVTLYWPTEESHALSGALALQEIEVYPAFGEVAHVVSSVSASSSDPSYPASNLIDGDKTDPNNAWMASSASVPQVIVLDLGSVKDVYMIKVWPWNKRTSYLGNLFPEGSVRAPQNLTIELSDDGATWGLPTPYKNMYAWPVAYDPAIAPSAPREFLVTPVPLSTNNPIPVSGALLIVGYAPLTTVEVFMDFQDTLPYTDVLTPSYYHGLTTSHVLIVDSSVGLGVSQQFTYDNVYQGAGGVNPTFTIPEGAAIISLEATSATTSTNLNVRAKTAGGATVNVTEIYNTVSFGGAPHTANVTWDLSQQVASLVFEGTSDDFTVDNVTIVYGY